MDVKYKRKKIQNKLYQIYLFMYFKILNTVKIRYNGECIMKIQKNNVIQSYYLPLDLHASNEI